MCTYQDVKMLILGVEILRLMATAVTKLLVGTVHLRGRSQFRFFAVVSRERLSSLGLTVKVVWRYACVAPR